MEAHLREAFQKEERRLARMDGVLVIKEEAEDFAGQGTQAAC